mgnify:CR=1 FL=1
MVYSVVIPVYNSSATIESLQVQLMDFFTSRQESFEIIFVDDRSTDNVWSKIEEIVKNNKNIRGYRLAKNSGQHSATLCGIYQANGDVIITIDDDLQYPVAEIAPLINYYNKNDFVIVFGISEEREKTNITNIFYKSVFWIVNHVFYRQYIGLKFSSFRIFSRTLVRNSSANYSQVFNPFYLWEIESKAIGNVIVKHNIRPYGKSNYNLIKLFKHSTYALNHILGKILSVMLLISISCCLAAFVLLFIQIFKNEPSSMFLSINCCLKLLLFMGIFIPLLYITKFINRKFLYSSGTTTYLISDEI